jgi:hypothetical protein
VVAQEAAKLPSEFILDLDFEDIELVEKGLARPLVPVGAHACRQGRHQQRSMFTDRWCCDAQKIGRVPKPMALKQVCM